MTYAYSQEPNAPLHHDSGRIMNSAGSFVEPLSGSWTKGAFLPSSKAPTSLYDRILRLIQVQGADQVYILVHGANRRFPHITLLERLSCIAPIYLIPIGQENTKNRDLAVIYLVSSKITTSQMGSSYVRLEASSLSSRTFYRDLNDHIRRDNPLLSPLVLLSSGVILQGSVGPPCWCDKHTFRIIHAFWWLLTFVSGILWYSLPENLERILRNSDLYECE
jgi:hypothetical protein